MENKISLGEAAALWLNSFEDKVAFFDSELYSFLYYVRETKSFANLSVKGLRKDSNLRKKFLVVSDYLISNELVVKDNTNYFTLGNKKPDDLEVVCSLYNTGYISYLSAMRFYGLTNRLAKRIDYTAPTRTQWKQIQLNVLAMNSISDSSLGSNTFTTPYPSERIRIKRKYLNVHTRSHLSTPKNKGRNIRIIEIGELFLEMLRRPELCGGFQHVLEVYEEMAEFLLGEIVEAVDNLGNDMDKSRVGFILGSYLLLSHKSIEKWKGTATGRGGSRKLIPQDEYSEVFNEEWCISLNHSVFYNDAKYRTMGR